MPETITQQQTHDHIFGAGALTYEWWEDVHRDHFPDSMGDVPDGWTIAVKAENPMVEGSVTKFVNHWSLLGAMHAIAHPMEPWGVEAGESARQECRAFLFDPEQSDFDADTADIVLQVAVFGKVHFG